jgi:superoxide dismutase
MSLRSSCRLRSDVLSIYLANRHFDTLARVRKATFFCWNGSSFFPKGRNGFPKQAPRFPKDQFFDQRSDGATAAHGKLFSACKRNQSAYDHEKIYQQNHDTMICNIKTLLATGAFLLVGALAVTAQPFSLPALGYAYDALEPYIDAETMEIHHSRHHQAYANNLNNSVKGTRFEEWPLENLLLSASKRGTAIRNNGGGHYNHTLFWEILSPAPAKAPTGALLAAIQRDFQNLDELKSQLNKAAATRFGSGWAWLYVTVDKKLAVGSSPNQDNPIMDVSPERGIPILGIDVWEHAYYLKYQNKRGDYLAAIWNVLDWDAVGRKYAAALEDPLLKRIELSAWAALQDFHGVMSQTFHPAEEGDFKPIMQRSGEMAAKAKMLLESPIPASFRNDKVANSIKLLATEAEALDEMVKKKVDEAKVKTALFALHDRFHEVMKECND